MVSGADSSPGPATESSPLLGTPPPGSSVDLPGNSAPVAQFAPASPLNPRNWSPWRKWLIIAAITPIDLSVSWGASSFSAVEGGFAADFGIDHQTARLGLSLYILGLALGPMSLAPLSEVFGRNVIYTSSYGVFLAFLAGTALAPSVAVFMVFRFLSGIFAAVTIANFGGTIADLYTHSHTGRAMSIYLWAATCGSPSGFFLFSAIAQTHGWREVFWAVFLINGALWLIMVAVLRGNETRHTAILHSQEHRSAREIANIVLTRPFRFLSTEAIVIFGALYNGFLYGLSFLFNVVFVQVFGSNGHGFSTFGVGCAFLGIMVGISLGPLTNLYQERYYQRAARAVKGGNIPEARVQLGKVAAVVFPVSLLWFAWTTAPEIHPLIPITATAFWGWAFYTLILMTFQYTEDSYRVFSASALAGIGLIRNIAGAAFPLFGQRLFTNLGYEWGTSLLALLALVLMPIPFFLEKYGVELRKRSPWARHHVSAIDNDDEGGEEA